ncbi:MAG: calcium/sodium antiporter, partial [Alphaproteobacteria bacterium]
RGAVRLARKLGLSTLLIGLTVVAFGTSAPEFVTALTAALAGAPSMAVGNIIGSNIANLLLVLGVAALARPILCTRGTIGRDAIAMLLATVIFIALAFLTGLQLWHGLILVTLLLLYIGHTYRAERRAITAEAVHVQEAEDVTGVPQSLWTAGLLLGVGLAGILIGADLLVRGGTGIARFFGLSEAVIGLTLVALGTSLPELATAVMASRRNHGDVAIGNILGSNIFNLLGIAGGVAIAAPLPVPAQILSLDIWILLVITILVLILLLSGRRLGSSAGIVLISAYAAYILFQVTPLHALLGAL